MFKNKFFFQLGMFSEVFVGEITSQVLIFIKKFLYEPLLSDIF